MALAQALRRRGVDVVLLGRVDGVDWLRTVIAGLGVPLLPGPDSPDGIVEAARALRLDAVVIDSHTLDPGCTLALQGAGIPAAVIVDGATRGQLADLYIDQDPGGGEEVEVLQTGAIRVGGMRHALLREAVSLHASRSQVQRVSPPRVVCHFGATDPTGAAPTALRAVLDTGLPLSVVVVVAREELREELEAIAVAPEQSVLLVAPTERLLERVAAADLVVTAAGSSVLEALCLGTAAAVLTVVDSQRYLYDALTVQGLVVGLGGLGPLREDPSALARASALLHRLIASSDVREAIAARGPAAVDGHGCSRVAELLLGLIRDQGRHDRFTLPAHCRPPMRPGPLLDR
nr:spore coat protein [Streptomyces sp. 846.5]